MLMMVAVDSPSLLVLEITRPLSSSGSFALMCGKREICTESPALKSGHARLPLSFTNSSCCSSAKSFDARFAGILCLICPSPCPCPCREEDEDEDDEDEDEEGDEKLRTTWPAGAAVSRGDDRKAEREPKGAPEMRWATVLRKHALLEF